MKLFNSFYGLYIISFYLWGDTTMKRMFLFCSLMLLLLISACTQKSTDTSSGSLTYSNLADHASQEEITKRLTDNGVNPLYAERFINMVSDYNSFVDGQFSLKDGFVTKKMGTLNYEVGDIYSKWTSLRPYADANCRITAFGLFQDWLSLNEHKIDETPLNTDVDAIENYPACSFSESEKSKFLSLYEPVHVEPTTDSSVVLKAVQKEWKNRGLAFKKSRLSLISVIMHSELDNTAFVGHTGIMLKDDEGILFIEKYGPTYPYQATKFQRKSDVEKYLLNRFGAFYTEGISAKPVILKNDKLF